MREIKFRLYETPEMLIHKGIMHEPCSVDKLYLEIDQLPPYMYELMQYTGLKDKNGVEIYEGDIIKIVEQEGLHNGVAYIEYVGSCFVLVRKGLGNLNIYQYLTLEVVGNIYENKELLNEQT